MYGWGNYKSKQKRFSKPKLHSQILVQNYLSEIILNIHWNKVRFVVFVVQQIFLVQFCTFWWQIKKIQWRINTAVDTANTVNTIQYFPISYSFAYLSHFQVTNKYCINIRMMQQRYKMQFINEVLYYLKKNTFKRTASSVKKCIKIIQSSCRFCLCSEFIF